MVSSLPHLERRVLVVLAFCLSGAALVHVIDLWQHGWLPYRFAPLPLNAYWTALTLLDADGLIVGDIRIRKSQAVLQLDLQSIPKILR